LCGRQACASPHWVCWQQMPPETDWQARLNGVDWSQFHTIYGLATKIPEQIERLHSSDEKIALLAVADLCAGLCHQHVQIASAALPAFPFVLEMLPASSNKVKAEILDMLVAFAITTDPVRMQRFASAVGKRRTTRPGWVEELREALKAELPRIAAFATHEDPTIAEPAKMFADELGKDASAG
jgi:hypothetical protein